MGLYPVRGLVYYISCKSSISDDLYHEIMKTMILDFDKKNFMFDRAKCRCCVITMNESDDRLFY